MSTKTDKSSNNTEEPVGTEKPANDQPAKPLKCGIIMPIADNPDLGYPLGHWGQVRDIVIGAAESAGFKADMVSNDTQVDLIHATIIKNIYANDVAVCDVSSRNPNVMFELGLRIASKKPVILIKDETTPFSFDTQLIPHLGYRRDLRLFETLQFQKQLQEKIETAHQEAQQQGYKSFLEQFTSYTLAQIDEQQVGVPEYLLRVANQMQSLEDIVKQMSITVSKPAVTTATVRASGGKFAGGNSSPFIDDKTLKELVYSQIEEYLISNGLKGKRETFTASLLNNIKEYIKNSSNVIVTLLNDSELERFIQRYFLQAG